MVLILRLKIIQLGLGLLLGFTPMLGYAFFTFFLIHCCCYCCF